MQEKREDSRGGSEGGTQRPHVEVYSLVRVRPRCERQEDITERKCNDPEGVCTAETAERVWLLTGGFETAVWLLVVKSSMSHCPYNSLHTYTNYVLGRIRRRWQRKKSITPGKLVSKDPAHRTAHQ